MRKARKDRSAKKLTFTQFNLTENSADFNEVHTLLIRKQFSIETNIPGLLTSISRISCL